MKYFVLAMVLVMSFSVSGCFKKKTATEQLKDDFKKATDKLNKEVQSL